MEDFEEYEDEMEEEPMGEDDDYLESRLGPTCPTCHRAQCQLVR